MDDRALERATDRWRAADIIDAETASAIRDFEQDRSDEESGSRMVWIIAFMGAGLVGAGILVYLATQWENLGTVLQTGILVAIPIGLGLGARELDNRESRRVAQAIWLLTAISVGPSLLLLSGLHWPGLAEYWPVALWGAIVLPLGFSLRSPLTSALGLGTLLVAVGMVGDAQTGIFVSAILGAVILTSVPQLETNASELVLPYRVIGLGVTLIPLLWMTLFVQQFGQTEIVVDGYLVGGLLIGFGSIAAIWLDHRRESASAIDVATVAIPPVAVTIGIGLLLVRELLPDIVGVFGIHLLLGGTLLAIAGVGSLHRSRPLINLVAVGFLAQVFTILGTITDSLSGALALIVSGAILVIVALVIERGRRRLLATIGVN